MEKIKKCKKCGGDVREVIINSFPQQRKMKCIECGLEHFDEEPTKKEILSEAFGEVSALFMCHKDGGNIIMPTSKIKKILEETIIKLN